MFLWFAGGAIVIVWAVFQDPAIDFRLVVLGALVPDLIDGPLGGARVMHSLVACATLLIAVMLATRGRRGVRRRLLAVPIGAFIHLLLDGMWTDARVFWWPFQGWSFGGRQLPSFGHPVWLIVGEEVVGAGALLWCVVRFGLTDRSRLGAFVRSGRLRP